MGNHNENKNNDNSKENQNNANINEKNDDKDNDKTISKDNIGRKRGRSFILLHTKYSRDNIILKLNFLFYRFILDFIHKHMIDKTKFLRKPGYLAIRMNNRIKNERLLTMKISDILSEKEISLKYLFLDKFENRKIIDKIYDEKKERNVIKILELTFEELFIIFRRKLNDPEDLLKLEKMKDKIEGIDLNENNNQYDDFVIYLERYKNDKDYIEKITKICLNYEKIMRAKKGSCLRQFFN